jgi:deoxyribonucleoside regulator
LVKIAHYYYCDGLTQEQIAQRLSMSRQKVNRLMKRLQDEEIVKIEINYQKAKNVEVERELEDVFGLKEAVVINEVNDETLFDRLGLETANYLEEFLQPHDIIGFSWGKTLQLVAEHLKEKQLDLSVVQLAGGMILNGEGQDHSEKSLNQSDELVVLFSQCLGGTPYFLHAPVFVEDASVKKLLMDVQYIKNSFEMIKQCNKALLSIGGIGEQVTPFQEHFLSMVDLKSLQAAGAVGHICFRYYDIKGKPVTTDLDDRTIAPTFEQLKKIPNVIGVGAGKEKGKALLGALRANLIDIMITDVNSAKFLLNNR